MRCFFLWVLIACVKGDWILVARLEQDTPSRRRKEGKLSPAVCSTCIGKLADTTINSLMGNGVVKLELIRQSTLECRLLPSVVFFDVGIGNFDSLARRQVTPFSLSESAALAGNFSTPSVSPSFDSSRPSSNQNASDSTDNEKSFITSRLPVRTVCNFGADVGTFGAAYAWALGDNCTNINPCAVLTLISVWIPSGSSPSVDQLIPAPTTSPSGGVVAEPVVLMSYRDFFIFGGSAVAVLLVCCALVCLLYHYHKSKRKAAKKRAKHDEREMAVRFSGLQPAETASRSIGSQLASGHSSLHAEGHPVGGQPGVSLIQDGFFISYPIANPPPYSAASKSGRTPPYTKSTFPSAKTILPLTPIKLPETPRRSRTPPTPRSRALEQTHTSPFRFAFRSLNNHHHKLSPHQHHARSNSSPEFLSRLKPNLRPTLVSRRGSTSSPPAPSHVFCCGSSPYFVIRLLGKGHFGTAYLVTDNVSYYVLKTLHTPSSNVRSKGEKNDALKEAMSLASFSPSPHLLACRDFFFEGSTFCIVVNYCSGGSLQDQIQFRLSPDEIFRILAEVSAGLAIIHSKGFIHRDIKPDNLFFANAEERTVVIGDMGLARRVGADGYYTNSFGHTLYKAPEVQFGKWSKRSDMWAVGCVGLDLLSGKSMEERCKSNNMILGMKTDVELAEIIKEAVGDLGHPVVKVVRALLLVNPYRRLSAEQVLEYKATVQTDPMAEPPANLAQAPIKSPVSCDFVALPETIDPNLEMCSDGLLADVVEGRSPSPLFLLSTSPSPPLQPIDLPPSPVCTRKFSFCLPAKEPSAWRHESVEPSCPSRSLGEEGSEFSPLMSPVIFYSAQ